MANYSKKTVTIVIILVCVGLVVGITKYRENFAQQSTDTKLSKIKGPDSAPVKVVEFIDFQCPACAFGSKYLKEFIEKQPGVIQLTMKYFPLNMHRHAYLSAQYAECAARQDKFWSYQDLLIERQGLWKRLTDAKPAFDKIGEELGLNSEQLISCLDDKSVNEVIDKDKEQGKSLGIRSTPTYFVNDEMAVGIKALQSKIQPFIE